MINHSYEWTCSKPQMPVLLQPFLCTKFFEIDYKKSFQHLIGNFFMIILNEIEEQTRKLAVDSSKHCFEVVDKN